MVVQGGHAYFLITHEESDQARLFKMGDDYGLDVIDGEWLEDKFNHPLIAYSRENPRLYITPHVGGTSPEATRISVRHTFQKIVDFFQAENAQSQAGLTPEAR